LTSRCNLSCAYCYVTQTNQRMDISTAQRAVDAVFRSALTHGYTRVKLKYAGGEPTLHFEALQAAQQRAETLSAQTGIDLDAVLLTNGVHITDVQMDTLFAHDIRVAVSLDGVGRYQDVQRPLADHSGSSFELVANTLDRLLARGISPHISITVTKQSLGGLPELVEYLLDRELRFSFNFYREPDRSPEQDTLAFTPGEMIEGLKSAFQVIEKRLPEYSLLSNLADRADLRTPHLRTCGVGQNYIIVDCTGDISKCQMDMKHPITTIDADDPLALVRADTDQVQNLVVDQKECRKCVWRYRCTGGCPRLAFQCTGRYDAKSPLCQVYQAILPEVVRMEALRLLKYKKTWDFRLH
ncbi:MAG: radical SAM protein, partial [Chloroflexi bacterium]|nr:radical SAM protein [Chloroflexota bacterium]